MKFILLLLASVFIALAWLLPVHYRPWVTYTGELYAFLSLFALASLYLNQKIQIPKITLPLFALCCLPFLQLAFGIEYFLSTALMSTLFIFAFWLSIVLGYNLSVPQNSIANASRLNTTDLTEREKIFTAFSSVLLLVGVLTSFIAICQWLKVEHYFSGMVHLRSNRPFANFAQPNNMSTFLLMSLMATWYLYEKQSINTLKKGIKTILLSVSALLIIFAVVLSQSRTAWVFCLLFMLYVAYRYLQGYFRLKWYFIASWITFFIACIVCLPLLDQVISQSLELNIAQSQSVVERATTGHLRLEIWQQMLYAISDRPWFGYGWHQTTVAQSAVSEYFQITEWVRSSHNFILDLLVWNGLLIGLPLLAYLGYWAYQLNKNVNSIESVMGILMLAAFFVHAMLEFPQNYAYFLLPVGFILGLIQSQKVSKSFTLSANYMRCTFVLGLVLLALIYRDYDVMVPKLNQSIKYEKTPEKITNQDQIYVLSEFNRRIAWIRLNPYSKVIAQQLAQIDQLVQHYPTRYDLVKYAKLLAFNGYEQQAKHQLWKLKVLRKVDVEYASLLQAEAK